MPGIQASNNYSRKSFKPIRLDIVSSVYQRLFVLFTHVIALVSLATVMTTHPALVAVMLGVAAHGVYSYRKYFISFPERRIDTLVWQAPQQWLLGYQNGDSDVVQIITATFISSWLIILRINDDLARQCKTIYLTPDAVDRQSYHALRVRLQVSRNN